MWPYRHIRRVCVLDSAYALLLYFLISSENEIKSTYYFWGKGIPEQVRAYFRRQSQYFGDVHKKISNIFELVQSALWYRLTYLRWPFLAKRRTTYWGFDVLSISPFIVHKHKIYVIEDGLLNYHPLTLPHYPAKVLRWFGNNKMLGGDFKYSFEQDWCEREYITNIIPGSKVSQSPKAVIISMKELWEKSPETKRQLILDIYGLDKSDIVKLLKYKDVLLTQPFSEEGGSLTEQQKVDLYKEIIAENSLGDILIKTHPRERTDYTRYFPAGQVFSKKVPLELLQLIGVDFDNIYTINSTAAYNMAKYSHAKVTMFEDKFPKNNDAGLWDKYIHNKWYYYLWYLPSYLFRKHILHKP